MGMLRNRIVKNFRHLRRWAERQGVRCYRVYDRDIPEHPVTLDLYGPDAVAFCAQRGRDCDPEHRQAWLQEVRCEVQDWLGEAGGGRVFLKERRPGGQYPPVDPASEEVVVEEGGLRFLVNLAGYHDTGLFLDHRDTRAMIRELAAGKTLLNLFCYTGSFSVYAAAGGARATTSVDLSNTYLDWAERNFRLNRLDPARHRTERADVLEWLARPGDRYDLIVCDPPTFSNSKRMADAFEVDRDHPGLLRAAAARLAPGGRILFSTNQQRFRLEESALEGLASEEITRRTVPEDFRNRPAHRAWWVTAR